MLKTVIFLIARVKEKNFCRLCGAREAGAAAVNWICNRSTNSSRIFVGTDPRKRGQLN